MQVGRKQRWFLAMAKNWVNRWGPCDCFRGLRRAAWSRAGNTMVNENLGTSLVVQ